MVNRHEWIRNFCFMTFFSSCLLLSLNSAWSQTKPVAGIRENTPQVHALINAKIVQAPGRVIEKGTVVLRDGAIAAVGADVNPPADARIWDYEGLVIYPGLIEAYSHLGLPKEKKESRQPSEDDQKKQKEGPNYWNPHVRPEKSVLDSFQPSMEDLKKMRALGFTTALIVPQEGIFAGTSALVNLVDEDLNEQLLQENVAQHLAFELNRDRTYPNSLMGAIALIRQTILDAQWYGKAQAAYQLKPAGQTRPETNEALQTLNTALQARQSFVFKVDTDLDFLRAQKIADEFGLNLIVRGSGYEYRIIERVKAAGVPIILPIAFPEAPDVEKPAEALSVTLEDLQHWDAAPENPKVLQQAGLPFAFTSDGLKKPTDFPKKIRETIDRGLSSGTALAAWTINPAKILGFEKLLGTIDVGKLGNLVVTDGELFAEKTHIIDVWVAGKEFEISKKPEVDPRGRWQMTLKTFEGSQQSLNLELKGELTKLAGSILQDSTKIKLQKADLDLKRLTLVFPGDTLGITGMLRMSGLVDGKQLTGQGQLPNGEWFEWEASWQEKIAPEKKKSTKKGWTAEASSLEPGKPPGAYGFKTVPDQPKHILVHDATIWTSAAQGRIEDADLLITEGKIADVGPNLSAPSDAMVIEAKGKHVTPGLIDAHSHSGISRGVNESTQAVTAEVRVGDVINSHDIAFYRELAGGLTVINQLHGSANPIGGQNSVIKLRWGATPEELKISDAPAGIKFALGENVKQSNWGDRFTTRYPQTRMGVEQVIRDRFKAALDYEKEWQQYNNLKDKKGVIPPRRDLELEALLEVLHGERLVHSHSYRQDEILMLVRIAEDFGFTIGTFQHVLEGYKVADVLAEHGAGASTFSDWWAYKFEVYDAIPYNGALMHDVGVVVSFNSDSNELARRLYLEAAKAVKYGGLSEEEALKFVTINPAKQLHIDHRVGSLEPGKDGDFVIWSGNPLSTYTICEQTWIDGKKYFDREQDLQMRKQVETLRSKLIQKVLASEQKDETKKKETKSTF